MPQTGKPVPAREAAYLVLRQVDGENAYANLALKKFLDTHTVSGADSRLAAEIVYGTSRMRNALDYLLKGLLTRPMSQLMPEALTILRLSLYQLHFLDHAEPYAVVDEGVKLAKKYANLPISKLVNGVLRNDLRRGRENRLPDEKDIRAYLHITLSYPEWLSDMLISRFGAKNAKSFCQYSNGHSGIWLRTNTLKTDRAALLEKMTAAGITGETAGYASETVRVLSGSALINSVLLKDGLCTVQGAASQLAAYALDPQPGSRVLDLCAAPGGKTTHLAAYMQDEGEIHAFDIHPHKIGLIQENCRRLGISSVAAVQADAGALPGRYGEWAHYVLLDAPCSGLGVLSERPDSRFHKQAADIPALAETAKRLLDAAAGYVKPGGYLCFSTCTVTKEENQEQVKAFLIRHPEFELSPMAALAERFTDGLDRQDCLSGMIQLLPFRQGTEGFFLSRLKKKD